MKDARVRTLIMALAEYTQHYGHNCDRDMSIRELVDDLVETTDPPADGTGLKRYEEAVYELGWWR